MILIFSKNFGEVSTEDIIDWLLYYGKGFIRINGEDFLELSKVDFELGDGSNSWKIKIDLYNEISAVWYRRSFDDSVLEFDKYRSSNKSLYYLFSYLERELATVYKLFELGLWDRPWLSKRSQRVEKLSVLQLASRLEFRVPRTIVSNHMSSLLCRTKNLKQSFISKAITDGIGFNIDGNQYTQFTCRIEEDTMFNSKGFCFPTLIQEKIEKLFEIRIFVLKTKFYSMAIFSQKDAKTEIDFRNYNYYKPNRYVPYTLPITERNKVKLLLKKLNLSTASIDMIYTPSGDHILLEVNPVGQFGMVSHACNYPIEKEMANLLIKNSLSYEQKKNNSKRKRIYPDNKAESETAYQPSKFNFSR